MAGNGRDFTITRWVAPSAALAASPPAAHLAALPLFARHLCLRSIRGRQYLNRSSQRLHIGALYAILLQLATRPHEHECRHRLHTVLRTHIFALIDVNFDVLHVGVV